jgi:glycerol-3-phosphate dehydrogenase subunit C
MEKFRERNPDALVTDCLSCRLQFSQHLPFPVFHPVERLGGGQQGTAAAGAPDAFGGPDAAYKI